MPRRVSARGFTRSVRRNTGWSAGPGTTAYGEQQITAAGTTLLALGAAAGSDGLTLVRTRGFIEMRLVVITASGDGYSGAIGLAQVSDRAFAAGAASVPQPFTEADDDSWIWHQFFSLHPETDLNGSNVSLEFEIDSKAMRKSHAGETLILVVETIAEVGTATMAVYAASRVLDKLP